MIQWIRNLFSRKPSQPAAQPTAVTYGPNEQWAASLPWNDLGAPASPKGWEKRVLDAIDRSSRDSQTDIVTKPYETVTPDSEP